MRSLKKSQTPLRLLNELEKHLAIANSTCRPEPYGEIGATILEKIMLESKENPLFLLNTIFQLIILILKRI